MYEDRLVTIRSGHEEWKGRVLMMEEGVGISIVSRDKPDDFLLCVSGPLSDKWTSNGAADNESRIKLVKEVHAYIEECIIEDKPITMLVIENTIRYYTGQSCGRGPSLETCPFG